MSFAKFLPSKLIEKAFYWGPLFVGVIFFITGALIVRSDLDFKLQHQGRGFATRLPKQLPSPPVKTPDTKIADLKQAEFIKTNARDIREDFLAQHADASKFSLIKNLPKTQEQTGVQTNVDFQLELPEPEQNIFHTAVAIAGRRAGHLGQFVYGGLTLSQERATSDELLRREMKGLERAIAVTSSRRGTSLRSGIRLAALGGERLFVKSHGGSIGQFAPKLIDGVLTASDVAIVYAGRAFGKRAGFKSPPYFTGAQLVAMSGERYQKWTVKLGVDFAINAAAMPLLLQVGIANGLDGAKALKRKGLIAKATERRKKKATSNVDIVLAKAVSEDLTVAIGPLGTKGKKTGAKSHTKKEQSEKAKALDCSARFYEALQGVKTSHIGTISDSFKPISGTAKSLPGKWLFPLSTQVQRRRKRSKCVRYKTYYSGRRKCIKRRIIRRKVVSSYSASLSADEKRFVAGASALIRGKGRDPFVKPRSPSYWVVNRVARDLRMYSNQPLHPAICTGVPRMVNYFEGNLKRVTNRIGDISELSALSDGLIKGRVIALNLALREKAPITVTDNVSETDPDKVADAAIKELEDPVVVASAPPPQIELNPEDLKSGLIRITQALFGEESALTISAQENFISSLSSLRSIYNKRRRELRPSVARAFRSVMGIMEASFYLRRTNQFYLKFSTQMFGSLTDIKAAHQTHCNCGPKRKIAPK